MVSAKLYLYRGKDLPMAGHRCPKDALFFRTVNSGGAGLQPLVGRLQKCGGSFIAIGRQNPATEEKNVKTLLDVKQGVALQMHQDRFKSIECRHRRLSAEQQVLVLGWQCKSDESRIDLRQCSVHDEPRVLL